MKLEFDLFYRCDCRAYIDEGDLYCWNCGVRFIWEPEKFTEDALARLMTGKSVQVKQEVRL